ncbi:MAG: hypothetical protein DCC71_11140 [Proteobacteria bacterium]|nr:MAG: hypothetical protein DCC71_11140 [Pseudomonadota bacterium]
MTPTPHASRTTAALAGLAAAALFLGACHEVHFDPGEKSSSDVIDIYDDLFAVSAPSPNHVVAAGYWGSVYVSNDGGATWKKGNTGTRALLYDISMADDLRGWAVGQSGMVLRTEDGGLTWKQQQNNKVAEDTHLFAVHALDANTAWAVGEWGGRLFTDDGGRSWQDRSLTIDQLHPQFVWLSPPEQDKVRKGEKVYEDVGLTDVFCLPKSQDCWAIGEFGYIFHTENAGQTWVRGAIQQDISVPPITLGHNVIEISEEHANALREFAGKIIDMSHLNVAIEPVASEAEIAEFGQEDDPTPLFEILEARVQAVSAVLEEAGLLSDRIRKRGAPPWDYEDFLDDDPEFLRRYLDSRRSAGPGIAVSIAQNPYLFTVRFANENDGYIAGLGGIVLVSRDGGHNWQYRETGRKQAIFSLFPVDGRVIAVGEKGFVRVSNDHGDTWSIPEKGFPTIFTFMRDIWFAPDGRHGYIVGERGNVLQTDDAGANWKTVLPPPDHQSAAGG